MDLETSFMGFIIALEAKISYFYRLPLGKSLLARDQLTSFLVGVTTLLVSVT